jgi:hypothetical protein
MKTHMVLLYFITTMHILYAGKKKKTDQTMCPGISPSQYTSFNLVLQHAADLSSAQRHADALACFSKAVAVAQTDEERQISLFNLAVVQKDLLRSVAPCGMVHSDQACA